MEGPDFKGLDKSPKVTHLDGGEASTVGFSCPTQGQVECFWRTVCARREECTGRKGEMEGREEEPVLVSRVAKWFSSLFIQVGLGCGRGCRVSAVTILDPDIEN